MKFPKVAAFLASAVMASPMVALAQQCVEYKVTSPPVYGEGQWSTSEESAFASMVASALLTEGSASPGDCVATMTMTKSGPNSAKLFSDGCTVTYQDGSQFTMHKVNTTVLFSTTTRQADCPIPEDKCSPGTENEVNVTVGYSRTPGASDGKMAVVVSRPWEGGTVCYNGCTQNFGSPIASWWSDQPTTSGLYRGSMDMKITSAGGQCSDNDPTISPETGPGECSGTVGMVNGKPYCAGTSDAPVRNDQDVNAPLPSNTGNPPAGNTSGGGTGPGRTPSTGNGGPAGGPGGTGAGTVLTPGGGGSGSGVVNKPGEGTEQANCGAPGQPSCRIDETGTPTKADGKALMDPAAKSVDETQKGLIDAIGDIKQMQAEPWTWTFQLPTGCTNLNLDWGSMGSIEIDVCRHKDLIHSLMSFLWICAGIGGSLMLVHRTLST